MKTLTVGIADQPESLDVCFFMGQDFGRNVDFSLYYQEELVSGIRCASRLLGVKRVPIQSHEAEAAIFRVWPLIERHLVAEVLRTGMPLQDYLKGKTILIESNHGGNPVLCMRHSQAA